MDPKAQIVVSLALSRSGPLSFSICSRFSRASEGRAVPLTYHTQSERFEHTHVVTLLVYHAIYNEPNRLIQDLIPQIMANTGKRLVAKPRQPFRDVPN